MLREDIELCNENDSSDPDFGPAETWGLWADRDIIELGPAFTREESIDDPDQLPGEEIALTQPPNEWPLTGPEDLVLLRALPCTPWQNFLSTPAEIE